MKNPAIIDLCKKHKEHDGINKSNEENNPRSNEDDEVVRPVINTKILKKLTLATPMMTPKMMTMKNPMMA